MPITDPTRCNNIDYIPAKVADLVEHIGALHLDGSADPVEAAFRMLGAALVKRKQCEGFVAWPIVFWNKKTEEGKPKQLALDADDSVKLNEWLFQSWQRRSWLLEDVGRG